MDSDHSVSKKEYQWQLRDGWIPDRDYVFVSYASRDWEKVYPCVMALRTRGINVYIDIEFMENQSSSWLENFQERLFRDSGCKGIISFLSIDYMRSYACLVEQMANRTNRMRRHAGRLLPVFYVALEPELATLQQMAAYIYDDEVRRASTRERVEISPPEYTILQRFILDSSLDAYQDVGAVRELLDDIRDKHDVVINMYELIFSDTRYMPSIQLFEDVEKCAQLLADNFLNDKNASIKLTMLEDLKRRTLEKLGLPMSGNLPDADSGSADSAGEPDTDPGDADPAGVPDTDSGDADPAGVPDTDSGDADPVGTPDTDSGDTDPVGTLDTDSGDADPAGVPDTDSGDADPVGTPDTDLGDADPVGTQDTDSGDTDPVGVPDTDQSTGQRGTPAVTGSIVCPSCKKINKGSSRFCTECGMSFVLVQLCRRCGAALKPGKKFCSKCGTRVK